MLSRELVFEPEAVIDAFHELSRVWEPTYAQRYSRALQNTGIYFERDAEEEAANLGRFMHRDYITPFVIGENHFSGFDSLKRAVSIYHLKNAAPAIFVLGSGNTALPLILNLILGILTGQRVYFRASSGNREALQVWLASLDDAMMEKKHSRRMGLKNIRESLMEISHGHDDPEYKKILKNLPIQKAYLWGGGEAIENTIRCLPDAVIPFAFGPRTGVVIFEYEWWRSQSAADKAEISRALYNNLVLYDAALCSSPTFGIMMGTKEQGKQMLREITSLMVPHRDEQARFLRSASKSPNYHRMAMLSWKKYGYDLFSPENSLVKMALGNLDSSGQKNRLCITPYDYHSSAGLLEVLQFEPDQTMEAAGQIAYLQTNDYFKGLWSVGHIITVAGEKMAKTILLGMEIIQNSDMDLKSDDRILKVENLRVVDVRNNIGRKPGNDFDGIYLSPSMLKEPWQESLLVGLRNIS